METPNPFDAADQAMSILRNGRGQYSLWPETLAYPAGWEVVFGPAPRPACEAWLLTAWRDVRVAATLA